MSARRLAGLAFAVALPTLALTAASGATERIVRADRVVVGSPRGLTRIDPANGNRALIRGSRPGDREPTVDPAGTAVVVVRDRKGSSELASIALPTGETTWLTANTKLADSAPAWSPDGRQIAWTAGPSAGGDIYAMDARGKGKRPLVKTPADERDPAWSPIRPELVYAADAGAGFDLWILDLTSGASRQLTSLPGDELAPAWAPDGGLIAFRSSGPDGTSLMTVTAAVRSAPSLVLSQEIGGIAWIRDSAQLAAATPAGIVTVLIDGSQLQPLRGSRSGDIDPIYATLVVRAEPSAPTGPAPRPGELLPDLEQRAPRDLVVTRSGGRWLLGFTSAVDNIGLGPLWIRGWRPSTKTPTMRADQKVELRNGRVRVYRNVGRLHYTPHSPHYHWHLKPFERAELRRASNFELLVRDRKIGFCLADHWGTAARRARRPSPARFFSNCGAGQPHLLSVEQGNSAGFTDRYPAFFHGQNVDITRVAAGVYVLVHRANPSLTFHELDYRNNAASVRIRIGRTSLAAQPWVTVLRVCEGSERCPRRASRRR